MAVFTTFSSCKKEDQIKNDATLKQLEGKWECVWSDLYSYYDDWNNIFWNDTYVYNYVGAIWEFDAADSFSDGSAGGCFTLIANGQTYEGRYSISHSEDSFYFLRLNVENGVEGEFEISGNSMTVYYCHDIGVCAPFWPLLKFEKVS